MRQAAWNELYRSSAIIAISDRDEGKSITNDAEYVVGQIRPEKDTRLIYRDTDGRWDELKHDGAGNFTGFSSLGVRTLGEALQKCGVPDAQSQS